MGAVQILWYAFLLFCRWGSTILSVSCFTIVSKGTVPVSHIYCIIVVYVDEAIAQCTAYAEVVPVSNV